MHTEELENTHIGTNTMPIGQKIAWWGIVATVLYLIFIDK